MVRPSWLCVGSSVSQSSFVTKMSFFFFFFPHPHLLGRNILELFIERIFPFTARKFLVQTQSCINVWSSEWQDTKGTSGELAYGINLLPPVALCHFWRMSVTKDQT